MAWTTVAASAQPETAEVVELRSVIRWQSRMIERLAGKGQFNGDRWLPADCKAKGCHVQSQYLIRHLGDAIVHWHKDDETGEHHSFGTLVPDAVAVQGNRRRREAVAAYLAAKCHSEDGLVKDHGAVLRLEPYPADGDPAFWEDS